MKNIRIAVEDSIASDSIRIYITADDEETGRHLCAQSIAWTPINPGSEIPSALRLDNREKTAQELMDGLWGIGIRPRDIGTPGHLSATQFHLKDMRAIASKLLGVELK